MSLDKELDGFMVVSLEQAVAAPYYGTLLANAGARVIKVERPGGILRGAMMRAQMVKAPFLLGSTVEKNRSL